MMSLEDQLVELSIDDKLVDVTSHLRSLASRLKPESIIKAPQFDLFEGTHSLEINNKKLDSSLLELSSCELDFDCQRAYGESDEDKIAYVTAISDRLCRSVMVWLNDYQTLPTTVLSCRYVEYMLDAYTEDPLNDLSTCQLTTGHEIYDQVLMSCTLATCYFVKVVQTLFKAGVIFEEEDLNCNTMGLNILSTVPLKTIRNHVDKSLTLLHEKYPQAKQLMLILELLRSLASIHNLLPMNKGFLSEGGREDLEILIRCATQLKELPTACLDVPRGSFSAGIQKRLSNQFPPRAVIEPNGTEYASFILMAEDILKVLEVDNAEFVIEISQFAFFFNRCRQRHVVARALFPLYLMRNDQMVLDKYTFNDFSKQHLSEFSLSGTQLSACLANQPDDSSLASKFSSFLQEISGVLFEWYQNMSQNTCRYRQGYNRQLLLWDSLQAQIEVFEMELESHSIKDDMGEGNTLLPLTTWVYYMKLTAMLEYVLKGFELDVYKPWEFFSMFWYCYYLSQHLENCLQRVHGYLEKRIATIQAMNKKLKKLKAGEKKDVLRVQYRWLMDHQMPQLHANLGFANYLLMKCSVTKALSLVEVFHFAILKSYGIVEDKHPSSTKFSSPELVHKLRFKTYASIGVPELPSYGMFETSLQDFIIKGPTISTQLHRSVEFVNIELANAKIAVDTILNSIRNRNELNSDLVTGTKLVKNEALEYYTGLLETIEALRLNTGKLHTLLRDKSGEKPLTTFELSVTAPLKACSYYPILAINKK